MSLTGDELAAVRGTWANVAKDIRGSSIAVFNHFFEMYPHYQKNFKGFANVPREQLQENKRYQAHAFTVVSAINGMIDNIDDPELLSELLIKTGQNHKRRLIKIEDFKNLTLALLDLFSKIFGDAWTPVAESGWKKVFDLILEKVQEGLNMED